MNLRKAAIRMSASGIPIIRLSSGMTCLRAGNRSGRNHAGMTGNARMAGRIVSTAHRATAGGITSTAHRAAAGRIIPTAHRTATAAGRIIPTAHREATAAPVPGPAVPLR